jgi:hypothetical protein
VPSSVGPGVTSPARRHARLLVSYGSVLHDPQSNTIGTLLGHIAAIEIAYQVDTFERRGLTPRERQRWGALLDLGERARREIGGRPVAYYLHLLKDVRQKTANNYFKWFHVFEDEINHRGQIRWLCKRLSR